jgi:hypothetical protein
MGKREFPIIHATKFSFKIVRCVFSLRHLLAVLISQEAKVARRSDERILEPEVLTKIDGITLQVHGLHLFHLHGHGREGAAETLGGVRELALRVHLPDFLNELQEQVPKPAATLGASVNLAEEEVAIGNPGLGLCARFFHCKYLTQLLFGSVIKIPFNYYLRTFLAIIE